jgi:uncharacterized protein YcnI
LTRHRLAAGAAAAAVLALPASADAHVSIHPNVVPAGAFTKLSLRVPNETDNAMTTRVAVQMPPGFIDVSAAPPPGWHFSTKTRKLAKPVKTDEGTVTTEIAEIDFTGGKLPPGQFVELPISVAIPGKAGDVLTFKTVQTYSNRHVARWIGPPDADQPAPTIDVSAKNGVIEDVAGGEAGPPAGVTATPTASRGPAPAPATKIVEKSSGASKGVAIAALVLGIIGTLLGAAALARGRRAPVT